MTDDSPAGGAELRALREALDDLWGCIGKREMEHLQPETVRFAKENHAALWHTRDGPICYADGLPWWHPHHFATVKSPNEWPRRVTIPLDVALSNLRAAMEADNPGSSATGKCVDCGDVFFLDDPQARVGATYGFCSSECYDAYAGVRDE